MSRSSIMNGKVLRALARVTISQLQCRTQNFQCQGAYNLSKSSQITNLSDLCIWLTSAFCCPPSSLKTAATDLPFASLTAPNLLPANAPIASPGTLPTMNPKTAPHTDPIQVHQGICRSISGRNN